MSRPILNFGFRVLRLERSAGSSVGAATGKGIAVFRASFLRRTRAFVDTYDPRTDRFDGFQRSEGSDPVAEK